MEGGLTLTLTAGCSKWDIRQKVWDYIEKNNLADFPRPVHHRIPNFKGAAQACERLKGLQEFQGATNVKINPDTPQKNARFLTLEARKTLLVPTPRLRSGLFNKITPPPGATKEVLRICATSQGVRNYSVPLGLDAAVQVDLIVVGSVAVSEKGWRIGKGEGFADMEYAMMVAMGAVTDQTIVVTVVHDCQVLDIPEELLGDHDLTVDYILTPTRVIKTDCARPKPTGIIWSKISHEMMEKIPILKKLWDKERRLGKDVTLKDEPDSSVKSTNHTSPSPHTNGEARPPPVPPKPADHKDSAAVYIGDIPSTTRVSELKSILRSRDAFPLQLTWQGAQRRAFLNYSDPAHAQVVLEKLEGLNIGGHPVRVEMARGQRNRGGLGEEQSM
ncbi:methenyltetrahydrofolate synthase domain-containing protein isoform X1 [Rana temporaria]|uniref:methenyltetrahydrofolate synthase domain-containing protein isoform X1 n=1 Tax=Rana temporaria TaxID=8407 RepID=UPI001AAE0DAB|nr:methenyltetrahydrofolate synthase domain-containing protein isoform X1 [Rana temporaria]